MLRKPPLIKDGIRDGLTGISHRDAEGLRTLVNENQDMLVHEKKGSAFDPQEHWKRKAMNTTMISQDRFKQGDFLIRKGDSSSNAWPL